MFSFNPTYGLVRYSSDSRGGRDSEIAPTVVLNRRLFNPTRGRGGHTSEGGGDRDREVAPTGTRHLPKKLR